jgi:hypothetical protein
MSKKTNTRVKKQPTKWEKIFASYSSNNGYLGYTRAQKTKNQKSKEFN